MLSIHKDIKLPFLDNSSIESPMNSIISLPDPRTLFMGLIEIEIFSCDFRCHQRRGQKVTEEIWMWNLQKK